MNTKTEFLRIMAEQKEMALATSVNNIPNVRIVNFYFDPSENILYFSSFKDNDKVKEIEENPSIAFTTIPHTETSMSKPKVSQKEVRKLYLIWQHISLQRFQIIKRQ